jgi:flagellar motor switch protein FliG
MLRDELENMPPIRAKDAEQAQTELIKMTRNMAKNGEIEISENNDPEAEALF